jgi:phytoene synthase
MSPAPTELVVESREVLSRHARSFRWAGAMLPPDRLDDAAVVYAFCRLVDDLADEADDPEQARVDLSKVRAQLLGKAQADPLVASTRRVLQRGSGTIAPALHLIDGVLSDLDPVMLPTDAALHRYGYQVAGTVGLMMCAVLGVDTREATPFAVDLGVAMQLTNICRDVLEDARRGRVYLPADRLEAAGVPAPRLVEAAGPGPDLDADERLGLATVVRGVLADADGFYTSAEQGMAFIPWRARLAIQVASRVYRAIGVRLRRRGCDPWVGRTVVHWPGKLWWTGAALLGFARSLMGSPPRHSAQLHRFLRDLPGCHA